MRTAEAMLRFREGVARFLKADSIVDDDRILESYDRDISFAEGGRARLLVYPQNREDVRGIVRMASTGGVPLVPVSSGPPHFRGDTVPSADAVIVDFSRMKRIIRIDPVSRYAVLEPGVTYGELVPELRKQGLKLCIPLLPRATKSVVTSRLEREPGLIPKYQYDYLDPLLTLEVVYGTGDDFRTGSASGPGTPETLKADGVNPSGPGVLDFFRFVSGAQGTMGLVTRAATKVEVLPSLEKLFFITSEDVRPLVEVMNRLLRKRVVDECLALNGVNLAAVLAEGRPQDFEDLKKDLPPWTLLVSLAGYRRRPEERVAIMERYLGEICRELGLEAQTSLPGGGGLEKKVPELLSNPWRGEPYWKLRQKDACHDIFFLTTLSKVPEFVGVMKGSAARHGYPFEDIGGYLQPMVQGRGCHVEFSIPCGKEETAKVKNFFIEASETLINHGAFFSRPYGPWADMVYGRDGEGVAALKKLKDIFDPNNILNPGKLCFGEGGHG
ncbi:MAG: FAD-binding oxidoreductase [Chloroflexota bacterium]